MTALGYDLVIAVPPLGRQRVEIPLEQLVGDAIALAMPRIEQKIDETASRVQWRVAAVAAIAIGCWWAIGRYGGSR